MVSLLKEVLLIPSVSTAGLELIVFQFNPHILKRFNGVINCRDKGYASSDSVESVEGGSIAGSEVLTGALPRERRRVVRDAMPPRRQPGSARANRGANESATL